MPPVAAFIKRHIGGALTIVDPFCGESTIGTHRNDIRFGGVDAEEYVRSLVEQGVVADAVLFDPPYSPRQIAECYRAIGVKVERSDTQNARLYRRVRHALGEILSPGGVALSFGWQSTGFGRSWDTAELLIVQHGGAHSDTLCVAQRRRGASGEPPR